jgi:hypothetical protein
MSAAEGAQIRGIGEILYKGFLEKKGSGSGTFGRRNWKRRWLVVHSNVLSYYKDSNDASIPLGQIELQGCRLEADVSTKTHVKTHDHLLTLHTAIGRAFQVRVNADIPGAAEIYAEFRDIDAHHGRRRWITGPKCFPEK